MKSLLLVLLLSATLVNCSNSRPESYRSIQESSIVLSNPNKPSKILPTKVFQRLSHQEKDHYLQRLSEEERALFYKKLLENDVKTTPKKFKKY